MTFQLDTSGEVWWPGPEGHSLDWSDLSPFTQGYIEAAFASMDRQALPPVAVRKSKPMSAAMTRLLIEACGFGGVLTTQAQSAFALQKRGLVTIQPSDRIDWARLVATSEGRFVAAEAEGHELCGCGETTPATEAACIHCGRTKAWAQPAPSFSDLAPDTLAAIVADCEGRRSRFSSGYNGRHSGARFWSERQAGRWQPYPPLHASLDDDGKVRLTLAGETV